MLSRASMSLFLVSLIALAGCNSGSIERLVRAQVAAVQDLADLLGKITDADSAAAYRRQVEELVVEMRVLRGHIKALPDDEKAAGMALMKGFEPTMKAALSKLQSELHRIESDEQLRSSLAHALSGLEP